MRLSTWLTAERYTYPLFAEQIQILTGEPVSARAVQNWALGITIPRPTKVAAIKAFTRDQVTYDDHAAAYQERHDAKAN